jgi:UDP-glucose 4-epimerase
MKKSVLILGGAGFVGFNLLKTLAEKNTYKLSIADNFSRGKMDDSLSLLVEKYNIKVIKGDFTIPSSFNLLDNEYDQLYMLAAVVGVNNTLEKPHEVIRINTALVYNTLEWTKKVIIKKILYTSTSECYAGTIEAFGYKVPTPEEIPLSIEDIGHPRFTYAVTKMLGESGFLNYSKKVGFKCTVVRYHNAFGPRMGFKHVIPHLVQRFLNNESPFKIYGHDQTRSFSFISDSVEGTILAMESEKSDGEIYHIGSSEEISIEELIKETGRIMNYKGKYENAPTYPGSVSRRCPDITKAETQLGFKPKVNWKEGLKETVKWYEDFYKKGVESFEKGFEVPTI